MLAWGMGVGRKEDSGSVGLHRRIKETKKPLNLEKTCPLLLPSLHHQ